MPTSPRQDLHARALEFSIRAFKLYPRLAAQSPAHKHIAGQLFRAVTGIGALLEEGEVANSRRDKAAKLAIALREARESKYWARIGASDPRWTRELTPIIQEASEFVAMLTVSVRKLRNPPRGSEQ